MNKILFKELSYEIIGAAMEVHGILGAGFLEAVYEAALSHELTMRGITFARQKRLPVHYKGHLVGDYMADLIVDNKVILELKAIAQLAAVHKAQAHNYLVATGLQLAIVINFGTRSLQYVRVVRDTEENFGHELDE